MNDCESDLDIENVSLITDEIIDLARAYNQCTTSETAYPLSNEVSAQEKKQPLFHVDLGVTLSGNTGQFFSDRHQLKINYSSIGAGIRIPISIRKSRWSFDYQLLILKAKGSGSASGVVVSNFFSDPANLIADYNHNLIRTNLSIYRAILIKDNFNLRLGIGAGLERARNNDSFTEFVVPAQNDRIYVDNWDLASINPWSTQLMPSLTFETNKFILEYLFVRLKKTATDNLNIAERGINRGFENQIRLTYLLPNHRK